MIKNFFKIAWRNLFRNKVYSFINVFGLTVGITCFLLIALYIFDELTYDRFHKQAENIYRVVEHKTSPEGKESKVAPIAYNISTHALKDFPEVERIARISMLGRDNISDGENTKTFYESYWLVSRDFLKVFDFKLTGGNRATALDAPNSVIITEETARKLYGTTDAVGKTLRAERDSLPHRVTAVLKDFPANSHLSFNLAFSEATLQSSQGFIDFMTND